MALALGTRLGPYEVAALIGAGGMGEVYRARDTRLDRIVAIKVLREHLADDPNRRARFEREARVIANLSHPHICTLYDVGREKETDYLVIEYLDGQTLAERLRKGPLPIEQALQLAIQIVGALDVAHRAGITHRDLKPANVMLTTNGAKLLDFGIARITTSPELITVEAIGTLTRAGALVGTVQYMSPEQLQGREADARSDVFAFGALLFEMLTGRRAFPGDTQASVIAAVLEHEPLVLQTWQPRATLALERVVRKCLAKEPNRRWQTAADLRDEIEWIRGADAVAVAPPRSRAWPASLAAFVLVIVAAGIALTVTAAVRYLGVQKDERPVQFTVGLPDGWQLTLDATATTSPNGAPVSLALAPDGRRLAFVATGPTGRSRLWLRRFESSTAEAMPDTEGAASPFWSPDSRFIGFAADGQLKKIDVAGGPSTTMAPAPDFRGGAWSRNGTIVFAPNSGGLQRVSTPGGPVSDVVPEDGAARPSFLPDGEHFFYRAPDRGTFVGALNSRNRQQLAVGPSNVVYAGGFLLFLRGTTLVAQPFDARRLMLSGQPTDIAHHVQLVYIPPIGLFSASERVLAYTTGAAAPEVQLVWLDRNGKELGKLGDPGVYSDLSISPDGRRVALSVTDPAALTAANSQDLWLFDATRNVRTRFTFQRADEAAPVWSNDGRSIIFSSERSEFVDLYRKAADGGGPDEAVLVDRLDKTPTSWSADGRFVLYEARPGGPPTPLKAKPHLWVLPLGESRIPFPLLQTPFEETGGRFSPDARWVAYLSTESGESEVYVTPFPATGKRCRLSVGGAAGPITWRADGKEISWLSADRHSVMVASVDESRQDLRIGEVHRLLQLPGGGTVAAASDGLRFLAAVSSHPNSAPITIVLNWPALLQQ